MNGIVFKPFAPPLLTRLTLAYGAKVNVKGVLLCYRAAGNSDCLNWAYCIDVILILCLGRQMIAQGNGGKIIGACSISGYRPVFNALLRLYR